MARKRLCTILALSCLLMVLMANAAHAAITATSGEVVAVSPPPSVVLGAAESNTRITAFDEQQDVVTSVPVTVDIAQPGTYDENTDLRPAIIPAGTCVQSHYLHFDSVGSTTVRLQGSATFDAEILGVAVLDTSLSSTDSLGAAETIYPTGAPRAVDFERQGTTESVTLSADRRTLSVNLVTSGGIDALRVITACAEPEPGPPAELTLTPPAATNIVGEEHCVTATVTDAAGNPSPDVVVRFAVSGANTAGGSTTTGPEGTATFCYTGTRAGEDIIQAFADTNENGTQDVGEPVGVATKTYLAGAPANLTLSPKAATNPVGEEHCVTATVTDQFGNPVPRVTVVFAVTGAVIIVGDEVALGAGGSDATDRNGQATFCYTSELPGVNTITAYADTNGNSVQDPGEPADVATKTYVLPTSTPGCEVTITKGGRIIAANGDKATFGGNAKVTADGKVTGQEEYQDHGPAQPLNVHSLNVLAVVCDPDRSEATIYGEATVDGVAPVIYRIRVRDNGEPGTNDIYGILLSNLYYSGERKLEGGNVQIR